MSRRARLARLALAGRVALVLTGASGRARAQLHADLDAEAGAEERLLGSRPPSQPEPTPGPAFDLRAHVAVLPLLRAGAYVAFDLSPIAGQSARELLSAGLSTRIFSPWPAGDLRVFLALGFGYAAARAPGEEAIAATSGGFFEVPLGVGASYRCSRRLELIGSVLTRIGFGFSGSMYNRGPMSDAGNDMFGVALLLGAAFEL